MTSPLGVLDVLRVEIRARARPQGSLNVNRATGQVYPAAKGLRAWKEEVAWHAREAARRQKIAYDRDEPLRVVATFTYKHPASHYSKGRVRLLRADAPVAKTSTPDIDKLLRAVLDGLVLGGVIPDDRQVASVSGEKAWGVKDEVAIVVRPIRWSDATALARMPA